MKTIVVQIDDGITIRQRFYVEKDDGVSEVGELKDILTSTIAKKANDVLSEVKSIKSKAVVDKQK
jgi:hypothetical protein